MRVAHLTPHIGGGVGVVLDSFIGELSRQQKNAHYHHIFCLEKCQEIPHGIGGDNRLSDSMALNYAELDIALHKFDVTVCHYWNHPLLARYLSRAELPWGRLLFWIHNSGLQEPHIIPNYILDSGAQIIFTTPASFKAENVVRSAKMRPELFHSIPSARSLNEFLKIGERRKQHKSPLKRVLYLGTVSDAKMHPEAPRIFASLAQKDFEITVVGGPDEKKFSDEVSALGGRIVIEGWSKDTLPFYEKAEIFVYPLRRGHYGTGEQVILEAMASGIPVVAFDNAAEMKIIEHGETGFLGATVDEIIEYTLKLSLDRELHAYMSQRARSIAMNKFNSHEMAKNLISRITDVKNSDSIEMVLTSPKYCGDTGLTTFLMHSFFEEKINEITLSKQGDLSTVIFRHIKSDLDCSSTRGLWTSKTKGSPFHYFKFFPESKGLKFLCEKIASYIRDR